MITGANGGTKLITATLIAVAIVFVSGLGQSAWALSITDFSVFGGTEVFIHDTFRTDGLIGTNGDATVLGNADVKSIYGIGKFTGGTSSEIDGKIVFNGSVSLGGNTHVTGDVNSGGNITGGVNVTIDGSAIATGTITLGGGSTTGGSFPGGTPETFGGIVLPAATVFSAGGTDITKGNGQTTDLAPGVHGDLKLGANNFLTLHAGDYYFDSISIGNSLDLTLNLSGGLLNVYVVGDASIGTLLQTILGVGDGASQIYWETHGNFSVLGGADWYGTVYAPSGDIFVGSNGELYGAFWASGQVEIEDNCILTHQPPIPEPGMMLLVAFGAGAAALRRRKL